MVLKNIYRNDSLKQIRSVLQYNHAVLGHEGVFLVCQDDLCQKGQIVLLKWPYALQSP